MSRMPWSPTPRKPASPRLSSDAGVDFRWLENVVLPDSGITGLNPFNLSAYGLRACWPTLRAEHYCATPKVSLLGGWLKPSEMGSSPTRLHGIARSLQA